ncbi:MAG: type II toxin-antitoxin system VapC family toxin [Jiangellaceae bacterium]
MIVADASVVANMLVGHGDLGRRARAALRAEPEWAVPHHWTVEVFSAIRRQAGRGTISEAAAARAVRRLPELAIDHVPSEALLPRMWQLRASFTAYDAAYVAIAEVRGLTLVTSDDPLARAATRYCRVELVA